VFVLAGLPLASAGLVSLYLFFGKDPEALLLGLLFAVVFGGPGIAAIVHGVRTLLKADRSRREAPAPEEAGGPTASAQGEDHQEKRGLLLPPRRTLIRWWWENPWGVCVLSFLVVWIGMVIGGSSCESLVCELLLSVVLVLGSVICLGSFVLGILAPTLEKKPSPWKVLRGLAAAVVVACVGAILLSAIPGFVSSPRRSKYSGAAADTKTAVTYAIVYAMDKGVYPTSLKVLRDSGYANVLDTDRWNNPYVLALVVLTSGAKPRDSDDLYVYSKGPKGTGTYPRPFTPDTGRDGSVGYSSLYGSWSGL
jgi:type II secretory pathway pseudopilin PulG